MYLYLRITKEKNKGEKLETIAFCIITWSEKVSKINIKAFYHMILKISAVPFFYEQWNFKLML